jgi:two-component system chemotaxis response regulator CheY
MEEKKKVLVVDDSETNRLLLGAILSRFDLAIKFAEDGDEAVQKFHEVQPDIVFIDHIMPKQNGAEALHEMKNNNPNFIGILISALATPEDIKIAFEYSGAEEFIQRPFQSARINEILKKYGIINE